MALQFDRLVTTALIHPVLQAVRHFRAPNCANAIPILMYHSITNDPEPGVGGYYRLNTPPSLFRDHLRILRDEGFSVLDLSTALNQMKDESASSIAKKTVNLGSPNSSRQISGEQKSRTEYKRQQQKIAVLTFDDGFHDFLTAAWPALSDFGFTATVFLPTAFIGRERRTFKNRECLTWSEVRELRRQGVVFGSHTINHPKLWELSPAALASELRESRQTIEDELGESIDSFAHPYAFPRTDTAYVHRFREALKDAGYRLGVTTSLGCARSNDDPLLLKRLPANGDDDDALFRAKLHGAYNWLAAPQGLVKRAKRMIFR